MLLCFLAVGIAALFCFWMGKFLRKEKCKKYYKYNGFIGGFVVVVYLGLLSVYYQVFDGNFSYWYYITPFNALVLSGTIGNGYGGYKDATI